MSLQNAFVIFLEQVHFQTAWKNSAPGVSKVWGYIKPFPKFDIKFVLSICFINVDALYKCRIFNKGLSGT